MAKFIGVALIVPTVYGRIENQDDLKSMYDINMNALKEMAIEVKLSGSNVDMSKSSVMFVLDDFTLVDYHDAKLRIIIDEPFEEE